MFQERFTKIGSVLGRALDQGLARARQGVVSGKQEFERVKARAQEEGLNRESILYLVKNEAIDYRYLAMVDIEEKTAETIAVKYSSVPRLWLGCINMEKLEADLEGVANEDRQRVAEIIRDWIRLTVQKRSQYEAAREMLKREKEKPRVYTAGA